MLGAGFALLALLSGLATDASAAPAARRYSGTIRAVDLGAGPALLPPPRRRLRPHEMRGVVAYGEIPVSPADLLVGDYVTIESREEAGRGVAIRIIIVELPERSAPAR